MMHTRKRTPLARLRRHIGMAAAWVAAIGLVLPSPAVLSQGEAGGGEAGRRAELGFWRLIERTEAALAALPRDTLDPAAVVEKEGSDPKDLLRFVREKTFWVPYRGSLRGARGVLMDRLGNNYDRALLLSALLREAGHEARLAKAELDEAAARALLDAVDREQPLPANLSPRPGLPMSLADLAARDLAKLPGGPEGIAPILRWQEQREQLAGRVVPQALALLDHAGALPARTVEPPAHESAAASRRLAAMQEHVWVELREGPESDWIDLDPLPPSAPRSAPEASFPAGEVPDGDRHRVTVRVVAERWSAGRLSEETALERTFFPAEILGQSILFSNTPLGLPEPPPGPPEGPPEDVAGARQRLQKAREALLGITEFLPAFSVGFERTHYDKSVRSSGALNANPNLTESTRKVQKAVDALRGLGATGGEEDAWTAEWLEYRIERPGAPARVVRREVFDLVGPAARAAARDPAGVPVLARLPEAATGVEARLARASAAAGASHILVLPCDISPELVAAASLRQILRNKEALGKMLFAAGRGDRAAGAVAAGELKLEATHLHQLLLERKLLSPHAQRIYVDEPLVVSSHQRFELADPASLSDAEAAGDAGNLSLAIDIVHLPVAVRERPPTDAFAVRLEQGVLDTYLETVALGEPEGGAGGNCSWLHRGFLDAGVAWVALLPGTGAAGSAETEMPLEGWPADAAARVREARAAGHLVVAPPFPAARGEEALWAFWQIDPETGSCVGIGPHGWGAQMVKYSTVQSVGLRLIYVGYRFGVQIVCLYCKGLAAVELVNTTLQFLWFLQVAISAFYPELMPQGPPLQIPTPGTGDNVTDDAIAEALDLICSLCPGPKQLTGPKGKGPSPKFGRPPRRQQPPPRGGPNPAPQPKPPRKKGPPKNTLPR